MPCGVVVNLFTINALIFLYVSILLSINYAGHFTVYLTINAIKLLVTIISNCYNY